MSDNRNYTELFYDFYKSFHGNIIPDGANQELKYFLECRNNRLKRLNLEVKYDLKLDNSNIYHLDNIFSDILGTSKYNTMKYSCTFDRKKKYISNGSLIYHKKERIYFYETIYDVFNKPDYTKLLHNCPNCGAPSKIEELEGEGCKYCGTKFMISDLFPRVSNYYTMISTDKSLKDKKKFMNISGCIFGLILAIIYFLTNKIYIDNIILQIIYIIVICGLMYFIGLVAGSFFCLGMMMCKTLKVLHSNFDIISISKSAKVEIDNKLKQYDPNLKYEYFESKVLSLIRTILLNDNRDLLPQNKIANLNKKFDNLVDISYRNVIKLEDIKMINNYIVVNIYVYLNNDYFINGKIVNINERILVTMLHDNNYKVDTEFILSAINCKSCGASFDATHQKKCPYCNSTYNLEQVDWVVTNIQIM